MGLVQPGMEQVLQDGMLEIIRYETSRYGPGMGLV